MAEVHAAISKVEKEIETLTEILRTTEDEEEKRYLRKEKEQLRKEKEQLREKELILLRNGMRAHRYWIH